MKRLFTFAAIRIVQAQLEGLGNDGGFTPQATGWDGKVESPIYNDLRKGMEEIPLGDGDQWLEKMMTVNPSLSLRIMETRQCYTSEFDWRQLRSIVEEEITAHNTEMMRKHMQLSMDKSSTADEDCPPTAES